MKRVILFCIGIRYREWWRVSSFANSGSCMWNIGAGFFLWTAVGMVRFPDFYTRMHAVEKDGLSTMLMLVGFLIAGIEDFNEVFCF